MTAKLRLHLSCKYLWFVGSEQIFVGALLLSSCKPEKSVANGTTRTLLQLETDNLFANTGAAHMTLSAVVTDMTEPAEIATRGYAGSGLWFVNGLHLRGAAWVASDVCGEGAQESFGAHGKFVQRPVQSQLPICILKICSDEDKGLGTCVPVYHSRRKGKTLVAVLDFFDSCSEQSWARAASIILEE